MCIYTVSMGKARSFLVPTLSLMLLGSALACGDSPLAPEFEKHDHVVIIEPGHHYRLVLDDVYERSEPGQRWVSGALEDSPLDHMSRRAMVFKADDFGAPLNERGIRFIELLDAYAAPASLGVVTNFLSDDPAELAVYRELHERGTELWFHGHSHLLRGGQSEFRDRTSHLQALSFSQGQALAKTKLGIQFRTFGAPGNNIDEITAGVAERFSVFKVWFYGIDIKGHDLLVLPRHVDIEYPAGVLLETDELSALVAQIALSSAPVVTLQLHPLVFSNQTFRRLEGFLDGIERSGQFRYATPYGYWRWLQDQGRIELTKTAERTYLLDTTRAHYTHRVTLNPKLGDFELESVANPGVGERW